MKAAKRLVELCDETFQRRSIETNEPSLVQRLRNQPFGLLCANGASETGSLSNSRSWLMVSLLATAGGSISARSKVVRI